MTADRHCPRCGRELTAGSLEGLCPACVAQELLLGETAVRARGAEAGGQRPEVGDRKSEVRGQKSAVTDHDATVGSEAVVSEGPGSVIGRYKLLERIGEGGFGVVYMAEQKEPVKRRVALKIIKLGMDTKEVIGRFEAERQALALMDHPNIAKVLDGGATASGRPYFVMELVRGVPITQYCDQNNLPPVERLKLFTQVCHAIQHAHQKGIIHRDIKPSNVLVTLQDGVPVPRVIDFGLAKATQLELTQKTVFTRFHQFLGTPGYMSPEQAELGSLDIDTRSDIYSLGVLLYELLAGRTPFDIEDLVKAGLDEMRRRIREEEPVRPSMRLSTMAEAERMRVAKHRRSEAPKLVRLLRGDLDWIVMKCLEKNRARRYDTANGLALDLQHYLGSEPVVARPPSVAYRFRKLLHRHKLAFGTAALVALALVAGAVISTWEAILAKRAQREAEAARQRAEASDRESQHNLYVASMNLVQQAWDQNNMGRMGELLEETATYPGRGFEWYYWQRQMHLELITFRGHRASVLAAAFSPDGQRIVTGSEDSTAKVWEAATGKELLTLKGHSYCVWSLAFSPDGRWIVTGGGDATAKLWEAATGKELLTLKGHKDRIRSVAFSPDGRRIATASDDNTAKLWDAVSGKELLTLTGRVSEVISVAFSPDSQRIVTGSYDRMVKVWDAATGKELLTLKGHNEGIVSLTFSPDGQRILTGSYDRTAKVWEAATGKELLTVRHSDGIPSAAFSPDGQRIVTGSLDRTAKVWEAVSGKELLSIGGPIGWTLSVALSRDGQRVVTGSWDHTAEVWETTSGKELSVLKGHSSPIISAAFSPDCQRIVTGSEDRTARVWEAASGKELLTLKGQSSRVLSLAFSPDGQRIVTAGADGTAKVWEAASGKELLTIRGHSNEITSVAFSLDGQRIVTGSPDQTAKVWDAANGKELLTLKGHNDRIMSVAFSPDGQRIVTGSWDGTVIIWEAASAAQVASWLTEERTAAK